MRGAALVTAALLVFSASCRRDTQDVRGAAKGEVAIPAPSKNGVVDTTGLPDEGAMAHVAIGDLAGIGNNNLEPLVGSPYARDAAAIQEGHDLFVKMNCAGCHGYDLKGGMGPDLTDTYWRYGGGPAAIYKSIFEGRPQGMPAWGRALPPILIWKIVAYIESKGGAFPAGLASGEKHNNSADEDTTSASTLKGRNNAH